MEFMKIVKNKLQNKQIRLKQSVFKWPVVLNRYVQKLVIFSILSIHISLKLHMCRIFITKDANLKIELFLEDQRSKI